MLVQNLFAGESLLTMRRRCSLTILALILIVSSGGCGRKGPLKPLKQQPPGLPYPRGAMISYQAPHLTNALSAVPRDIPRRRSR